MGHPSTEISHVENLSIKEAERLAALTRELTNLGATVEESPGGLRIHPPKEIKPTSIDTYNDHRMAMSFALVGLKIPGVVINDCECCAKTFPDFFARFEQLSRTE